MNANTTPALSPPRGVTPNFVDPPSFAWATIFTMTLYLVVTTPFVAARMYTRSFVHKSLWWDDASQVLALIGLYGLAGIAINLNNHGSGVDLWNVTQANYAIYNRLFSDFEIVARVSIFFTKLSILQLYLRYFCPARTSRNWIWYATHTVIWFNLLYSIALILVVLLQCVGKHPGPGQSCVNENMVLVGASIINIVTDLMVLVIPIAAVAQMKMTRKTKLGVLIVFAVGALAVASSVARLGYQIPQNNNENRTAVNAIVIILAVSEQAIGQVAGCMPVLPALYRRIRYGEKSGSHNYSSGQSGSNRRRTGASRPSKASADRSKSDTEMPERDVPLRPHSASGEDERWQIETPTGDQDRLYVPITRPAFTAEPAKRSGNDDGHHEAPQPFSHTPWTTNTSYATGGSQSHHERGRVGSELGAGGIGVTHTIHVDVNTRQ